MSNTEIKKYNLAIPKLFDTILKLDQDRQERVLRYAEKLLYEDKRLVVRKACEIPVNYSTQNRIYVDHIKDISQNGLFIETKKPLVVGDDIYMSFNMKGYDRSFKISGEIVHRNRLGVGVEFGEIRPYIAQMLAALVKRLKG
jgi:Tfp pilus assembly protein PilZ